MTSTSAVVIAALHSLYRNRSHRGLGVFGDVGQMASEAALARMTAAGIIPVTTNTIPSDTHRTWNRPDAAEWGALYSELVPEYRAAAESYKRAQQAAGKDKAVQ